MFITKNNKSLFIMIVCLSMLAGCSQHLGNFTALSSSSYESKNIEEKNLIEKNVSGESHCYIIIMFPTCVMPKLDEAVSKALLKGNGDFMKNARLYYEHFYIPFLFGDNMFRVEGDVYKTQY